MDYHVKPISKTCSRTGEDLKPGELCYSVLVEENGEQVRYDYSPEGWEGPPEGTIAQWRSLIPEPVHVKKRSLDVESLMNFFDQLYEEASPSQEKLLYVLSLLLVQKKRLILEGSHQDGDQEFLQLSGSHGEGPYDVRDHQLEEAEIRQLQNNMNHYLETGQFEMESDHVSN